MTITAMNAARPVREKLVPSEFSGQMIPISCEAWRHECEVAFLLGLPIDMRDEMLEGRPGSTDRGVMGARGEETVAMLRTEVERLATIRHRRATLMPNRIGPSLRAVVV